VPFDVDATSASGVWFRHVPADGDPLFRPDRPADGRWQRGDAVEGFYLADSEETARAEWYRALAELALPPLQQLPRDLWRFEVDLARVADLSTSERMESVGLGRPRPDRRDWPPFQSIGHTLFADGWPGVLYPAAARLEGIALCLFRATHQLSGVSPLPPPVRYEQPPAPPCGLLSRQEAWVEAFVELS
jgi:RES domain-containing protein